MWLAIGFIFALQAIVWLSLGRLWSSHSTTDELVMMLLEREKISPSDFEFWLAARKRK